MSLNKQLTTVTTFSKTIAGILFVILPFLGFYLGVSYQKRLSFIPECNNQPTTKNTPPSSFCRSAVDFDSELSGTYINQKDGYQLDTPNGWKTLNEPFFNAYSPDFVSNGPDIVRGAQISINTSLATQTLDELESEYQNDALNVPINPKFVLVDGIKAYQFVLAHEGYGTFTYLIKDDILYRISIDYSFTQKDVKPYLEAYNQLLKTFKFIDKE